MSIIGNLKCLREAAGYKQSEVSAKLGVTQSAISQWESGACNPDYKYVPDLAKMYGCTLEAIIKAINQTDTA